MKGLYFYKLLSPYQDDVTKECKLTINEIDHNFITLKNTDIDSVNFDEETSLLTLNQINGDKFVTKIDLSHFTKDFNVEWNKEQSSLVFNFDDKEIVIDEIVGDVVDKSMTDIVNHIISQTITDNTLVGVGIGSNPLRLNPLEIPGTYKSVECLINIIDGEELPNKEQLSKGDRYLTYEKLNLYGYLYNYDSVKKIDEDLKCGWRVPTKEDWDNMLNAIELCDDDKNHSNDSCDEEVGKFAGKLLKHSDDWKINNSFSNVESDEPLINPNSTKGVNSYGFGILPSGYVDADSNYNYMGEQTEFWTTTETKENNVYTKRFYYNKSNLVQIAEKPSSLCSIRLVKDYNGNNFNGVETINGVNYNTVLMPSENVEHGYSIWTMTNVSFDDVRYNPIMPNNGNILTEKTAYYINEWDGFKWLKKQMVNGDSLVIKVGPDGEKYHEYHLINDILTNFKNELRIEFKDMIEQLTLDTVSGNGEYIASISQTNGNVSATTKTLVDKSDRLLTYGVNGVKSNINVIEKNGNKDDGVKKIYNIVDKNEELIGSSIVIEECETNETYISKDIPVVGGPLAEIFSGVTNTIKAGSNIQDLLFNLFCKEKFPLNPTFHKGSISATINKPYFNVYKNNDSNTIIPSNVIVEAGTLIDVSSVFCEKSNFNVSNSTWSGFDYGYSIENDNNVDKQGNPPSLSYTEPLQKGFYKLTRSFVGFDNRLSDQISNMNGDNKLVKLNLINNISVADGDNSIIVNVSGATFSTKFTSDVLKYYACSNLGNTTLTIDDNIVTKFISGETHTETSNQPTNTETFNIHGGRYSFVGLLSSTTFNISNDSIRHLTPYAFSSKETTTIKGSAGSKCVVLAYPSIWGDLKDIKDNNAFGVSILKSFVKTQHDISGSNGYKPIKYNVYVYKTNGVTLQEIDYTIKF